MGSADLLSRAAGACVLGTHAAAVALRAAAARADGQPDPELQRCAAIDVRPVGSWNVSARPRVDRQHTCGPACGRNFRVHSLPGRSALASPDPVESVDAFRAVWTS